MSIQQTQITTIEQAIYGHWSDKTFSTDFMSILDHFDTELIELKDEFNSAEHDFQNIKFEIADCALLLSHYAHRLNVPLDVLCEYEAWMSDDIDDIDDILSDIASFSSMLRTSNNDAVILRYMYVLLHLLANKFSIDVREACSVKHKINKDRVWGPPNENGYIRHI